MPEIRRPIQEPSLPTLPNIHPIDIQRTSPGTTQRPTQHGSPTSTPALPPIHGHRPPNPQSPSRPSDHPASIPHLPPINTRISEPESPVATGQPTPGSHRPPTLSNAPTGGAKQRPPDLAQRPLPNISPTSPALPPIHRRESPSPRSPPNSGDQPTQMPSLPPIHVGDSEFESRVATAAEAEQLSPTTQRHHNPNWPANWSTMSKGERRRWNRENPQPTPAPHPQPELGPEHATPPLPILKPGDWHNKQILNLLR